jgi:hypothetical protein
MAAITQSEVMIYEQNTGLSLIPNSPFGYKQIIADVPATADTGDTFTVDLSLYGITTFRTIKGFIHSASYSVAILEAPTTAVAGSTLTVTLGGAGANNQKRTYLIGGI